MERKSVCFASKSTFYSTLQINLWIYRHAHSNSKELEVARFGRKTATGPLCHHLYDHHIDEWVTNCDKLGIKITAKEAQDAVDAYYRKAGKYGRTSFQIPYSKKAFEVALTEFIVGDDQVCNLYCLLL